MICGLLITIPACSGGGFNPGAGGGLPLVAGLTGGGTTPVMAGTGETVIQIDFTVTGNPGDVFNVTLKYFEDLGMPPNGVQDVATEPAMNMTKASPALEMDPSVGTSTDGMQTIPASGTFVGQFFWHAALDLGFIPADYGVLVCVTSNDPAQNTTDAAAGGFNFAGGNPSVAVSGSIGGAGSAMGRAEHTANSVSGLNAPASATDMGSEVLIAGGLDSAGPLNNLDRFTLDLANRTNMASFTGNATAAARIKHASSMFLANSGNDNFVRVLVTGGEVMGAAVNTAEIYAFGPQGAAESVTATGNMNNSRCRHAACWLPDNRILVTGGLDAGGTPQATAEVFDPNTGMFNSLTVPGGFPARAGHTHCLLPNGNVLIAGGFDAANNPVNAYLFDPSTNTFTDTGSSVDRVDHTANLLVNGICVLAGGQTTGGTALSSVDFYRPFGGIDTATGGTINTGFTSPVTSAGAVAMGETRFQHAGSRLGDGSLLISGGFSSTNMTLGSTELFVPSKFTDNAIGSFTLANPSMNPSFNLVNDRARHTQTTLQSGSVALIGGVSGTVAMNTVLDTIEVFQFNNTAPTVSNVVVTSTSPANVLIRFDLADSEGDCSFVIVRVSVDGGAFGFASLIDYQETVNLAPGTASIRWNAAGNGAMSGSNVVVEIIPLGGTMGGPVRSASTMIN